MGGVRVLRPEALLEDRERALLGRAGRLKLPKPLLHDAGGFRACARPADARALLAAVDALPLDLDRGPPIGGPLRASELAGWYGSALAVRFAPALHETQLEAVGVAFDAVVGLQVAWRAVGPGLPGRRRASATGAVKVEGGATAAALRASRTGAPTDAGAIRGS